MKKIATISLAMLLLLLSARDLLTFVAFKIHQPTIASELCISKYEPIPMCFGQCFLDQQIETGKEKTNDAQNNIPPEISEQTVYFQSMITPGVVESATIVSQNFIYLQLLPQLLAQNIVHPPG